MILPRVRSAPLWSALLALLMSLVPVPNPPGGSKKRVAGLVVGLVVAGGGGAASIGRPPASPSP